MHGPISATTQFTAWKISNPGTGAGSFCRVYYRPQTWYRSGTRKRHATNPLPYTMQMGSTDFTAGPNQTCNASADVYYSTLTDSRWNNLNNHVSNRAASNFVGRAQGVAQASLGETLGEWRDSLGMITSRLGQLTAAARNLRRGDIHGAARALGMTVSPRDVGNIRKGAKTFGAQWLELHLGWVPLITDIYNANEAFMRDPFPRTCIGRARARDRYHTVQTFSTSKNTTDVTYDVGYHVRGDVHVVNPNIALLAQLGLANPVSVAWALVPYSFVVDWFINLGDLMGAYDGLLGCETLKTSYTTLRLSIGRRESLFRGNVTLPWELNTLIQGHGARCARILGLPPVALTYPLSPRFSWQRGATAVALLLQFLR